MGFLVMCAAFILGIGTIIAGFGVKTPRDKALVICVGIVTVGIGVWLALPH